MTLTAKRIEHLARELAARSDRDVTETIKQYDPEEKIALKHAIAMQREARGISMDGAAEVPGRRLGEQDGSFWLRRLNIHGPIDLKTLEARMTTAGLTPELRIEIKSEAIERRWLSPMYRVSAMGELSTDQVRDGRLASDQAAIDYGPEPLSLEMAGLYRRAGLQEDRTYSAQEVDSALSNSDLTTMHRIAVRHSLGTRLAALRTLQRQRPSMAGKGTYTMEARAAGKPSAGKILRDPKSGKAATLTFFP
jgi:hypothetical protein